ncbi:MAG: hypothetical protein HFG42_18665 [Lachnospiraceae bacterium]|nr:hypothetical protein [Lachnospiraceae bacterium]
MDKISFDSRYKFIVSLGIVLLVSPFIIIYILAEMSNDILITNKALNELSDISIEIIQMKQDIYIKIISSNIFYGFLIELFLIGIIFIIIGLYEWGKVQKQEYHKLELENEHFELENKNLKQQFGLSQTEQMAKVERELSEDNKLLEKEENRVTSLEYFEIEQLVAAKIVEKFSSTHDVVKGFKLGDAEYDVVAKGKGFLDKDYIFEIKYFKSMITEKWYTRTIEQIEKQSQNYLNMTNRLPYREIIIVTEKENYVQVENFISRKNNINNLRVNVLKKGEINKDNFDL